MTNHSNTFYEILNCARSLIIAGGYNGFSYADIAEFVGIRKASIHHHFPTKVDLVRVLVRQYREEAEVGMGEIERHCPAPEDQLRAYMGYWQSCIGDVTKGYCVCALLATQIPVLPQEVVVEVRTHFRALCAWLTSVLERGSQQGSFMLSGDARSEAEAFMATVHGAMLSARAYGDPKVFGVITLPLIDRLVNKQ
ncbi:TetR/AcrR family transcriptional regulator [Pseudomonas sp. Q11]|uniref:TetR/AcrR family transcriptional regulator n=1 Tax=Pseudomonas sp. Q11 TaxID=2968470 RepID=UPI00210B6188|nr:TetR/AcrR family transcriptional regulator [Pseudomonas sp. Q11]MCQ6255350.1 TetR/AcrR family transcriptional regulator [Pseudomonas sp. Q11]